MSASVTLFDVAAHRCRATLFNRSHDAPLRVADRVSMQLPISRTVTTQDVRQFQRGAHDCTQLPVGVSVGPIGVEDCGGSRSNGLAVAQTVLVATFR
ncbi:hypothetical protein BRPE67_ECDS01930 (plasmid) [Caballeronia cordobensis]|nr:hypothetical protein BRPE67_ECDS01930 [Burkholderia sp. RPE67]